MYSRVDFPPVSGAKCGFTTPPCTGLLRETAPFPPPPDPKIHKKTPLKKGTYFGALLATRATKKEHSGELGSQNDSKMEPKMEPKVIPKGSLLKNTNK